MNSRELTGRKTETALNSLHQSRFADAAGLFGVTNLVLTGIVAAERSGQPPTYYVFTAYNPQNGENNVSIADNLDSRVEATWPSVEQVMSASNGLGDIGYDLYISVKGEPPFYQQVRPDGRITGEKLRPREITQRAEENGVISKQQVEGEAFNYNGQYAVLVLDYIPQHGSEEEKLRIIVLDKNGDMITYVDDTTGIGNDLIKSHAVPRDNFVLLYSTGEERPKMVLVDLLTQQLINLDDPQFDAFMTPVLADGKVYYLATDAHQNQDVRVFDPDTEQWQSIATIKPTEHVIELAANGDILAIALRLANGEVEIQVYNHATLAKTVEIIGRIGDIHVDASSQVVLFEKKDPPSGIGVIHLDHQVGTDGVTLIDFEAQNPEFLVQHETHELSAIPPLIYLTLVIFWITKYLFRKR